MATLQERLRSMHDKLNCLAEPFGMKSEATKDLEREEAMALVWRAADALDAKDAEIDRWHRQSDDWQKCGWELGTKLDAAEAEMADAKREFALAARTIARLTAERDAEWNAAIEAAWKAAFKSAGDGNSILVAIRQLKREDTPCAPI